jgi:hypothetical protein
MDIIINNKAVQDLDIELKANAQTVATGPIEDFFNGMAEMLKQLFGPIMIGVALCCFVCCCCLILLVGGGVMASGGKKGGNANANANAMGTTEVNPYYTSS